MKYPFLFLIAAVLTQVSCAPKPDCNNEPVFEIPFVVVGAPDTIRCGEILWVESDIPDALTDQTGRLQKKFGQYDFSFIFSGILKIDSLVEQGVGIGVDTVQETGSLKKQTLSGGFDIYFLEHTKLTDDSQKMRYGFRCNQPGLYLLQFGHYDDGGKISSVCGELTPSWKFKMGSSDTNFEMLQGSPITFWQQLSKQRWEESANYCFWVKS